MIFLLCRNHFTPEGYYDGSYEREPRARGGLGRSTCSWSALVRARRLLAAGPDVVSALAAPRTAPLGAARLLLHLGLFRSHGGDLLLLHSSVFAIATPNGDHAQAKLNEIDSDSFL